jgi:hypothetical protein
MNGAKAILREIATGGDTAPEELANGGGTARQPVPKPKLVDNAQFLSREHDLQALKALTRHV